MTATRDPDRLLRAWLDLMPDEAPDRVVSAVLQATEGLPQVRRPLVPAHWRLPMNRVSILAAAAVIAVLIAGIAYIARPVADVGPQPTPSPSPTAQPAADVPSALRTTWLGSRRPTGQPSGPRSELTFSKSTITVDGELRGRVGVLDDELVVTSMTETPCPSSIVGHYRWSVGSTSSHLVLTAVEDACAARIAAYAGDWYHAACRDSRNTCWGDLDAGTYPTVNFGPRLDPDKPPQSNFGALEYTVPDGWTITSDHTTDIRLVLSSDATRSDFVADIQAWIRPAANVQTDPCSYGVDATVGKTAQALATWLHGVEALTSSAPAPITIGGKAGYALDIELKAGVADCAGFGPGAFLFAEGVGAAGPVGDDPWGVGISGQAKLRVILLDLGGGRTTMILIEVPNAEGFDAFVAQAMPIVESFTFE